MKYSSRLALSFSFTITCSSLFVFAGKPRPTLQLNLYPTQKSVSCCTALRKVERTRKSKISPTPSTSPSPPLQGNLLFQVENPVFPTLLVPSPRTTFFLIYPPPPASSSSSFRTHRPTDRPPGCLTPPPHTSPSPTNYHHRLLFLLPCEKPLPRYQKAIESLFLPSSPRPRPRLKTWRSFQ